MIFLKFRDIDDLSDDELRTVYEDLVASANVDANHQGDGVNADDADLAQPSTSTGKGKSLKKNPQSSAATKDRPSSAPASGTGFSKSTNSVPPKGERPSSAPESGAGASTSNTLPPGREKASVRFEPKRNGDPLTLRQRLKKTKLSLCNLSESTAHWRMTDQRLRVLLSIMEVREKLKDPLTASEIPEDLLELMYNVADHI